MSGRWEQAPLSSRMDSVEEMEVSLWVSWVWVVCEGALLTSHGECDLLED